MVPPRGGGRFRRGADDTPGSRPYRRVRPRKFEKETVMNTQHPAKRRSALVAVPPAILIEVGAIAVSVGGAVTATLAFLLCFAACHQIRLASWRHRMAQPDRVVSS
jgi:hypothetical protein